MRVASMKTWGDAVRLLSVRRLSVYADFPFRSVAGGAAIFSEGRIRIRWIQPYRG